MMRTFVLALGLTVVTASLPGLAFAQRPQTGVAGAQGVSPDEYRIGPEDVLQVIVWQNEALSKQIGVRPDGKISLPLLGDVHVAGQTPLQVAELLKKRLTDFINSPEVYVIVTGVNSFKVSIIGDGAARPGRYELRSRTTALEVLALSGGLNQFAAKNRIAILRRDARGGQRRIPFNYKGVLAGEAEDIELQPNDIILIP